MKRGPKKAIPIITTECCRFGCGNIALFQNSSGGLMCSTSANKCSVNRAKNAGGVKIAHSVGIMNSTFGGRQNWSAGLTENTDDRIKTRNTTQRAGFNSGRLVHIGVPHTDESKQKLSNHRCEQILKGRHDTSGKKGHRGHYNGVYLHSSWELAYLVYCAEVNNQRIIRNNTTTITYDFDNAKKKYVPDFILEDGSIVEIKGYLFSDRDKAKYNQTKHLVNYLFYDDIKHMISYCVDKYGSKFWEVLYTGN
jgi:hypothetical protein